MALGAKRLICFRKTNWPDRSNPSSRSVHEAQVATIRQDRCIILTPSNASMPSRAPASRQFFHSHRSVWSCKDNKSRLGLSCGRPTQYGPLFVRLPTFLSCPQDGHNAFSRGPLKQVILHAPSVHVFARRRFRSAMQVISAIKGVRFRIGQKFAACFNKPLSCASTVSCGLRPHSCRIFYQKMLLLIATNLREEHHEATAFCPASTAPSRASSGSRSRK